MTLSPNISFLSSSLSRNHVDVDFEKSLGNALSGEPRHSHVDAAYEISMALLSTARLQHSLFGVWLRHNQSNIRLRRMTATVNPAYDFDIRHTASKYDYDTTCSGTCAPGWSRSPSPLRLSGVGSLSGDCALSRRAECEEQLLNETKNSGKARPVRAESSMCRRGG